MRCMEPAFNSWPVVLLCLALLFLPLTSPADQEGDYTYTVSDGKATITDFNDAYTGPLTIADTLGGYPVTTIGNSARTSLYLSDTPALTIM